MSRWQGKRINEGCHCCSCTCAWRHLRQVHANLTRHEAAALVTTFRRGRADVTWMVDANFVCEMLCVTTCVIPFMPINVEHLRLLSWSFSYKVLQSTMVAGVWCGTRLPAHEPSIDTYSATVSTHTQCSLPAGFQVQKMGSPRARPLTIWASSAEPRVNAPKHSMWHTVCVS